MINEPKILPQLTSDEIDTEGGQAEESRRDNEIAAEKPPHHE